MPIATVQPGKSSLRQLLRHAIRLQHDLQDRFLGRLKHLHQPALSTASEGKQENVLDELKKLESAINLASQGKPKAMKELQELAYGVKGPMRTRFLRPHLSQFKYSDKPQHPLLTSPVSQQYAKRIKAGPPYPERDEVLQGPLPRCRVKNIQNRWWTNVVLKGLRPPLPSPVLQHLESLAQHRDDASDRTSTTTTTTTNNKGRRKLSARFLKRRAQALLDHVPVYEQDSAAGGREGRVRRSAQALSSQKPPRMAEGVSDWLAAASKE